MQGKKVQSRNRVVGHPAPCIRSIASIHSGFHRAFASTLYFFSPFLYSGEIRLTMHYGAVVWNCFPYRRFFAPCGQTSAAFPPYLPRAAPGCPPKKLGEKA